MATASGMHGIVIAEKVPTYLETANYVYNATIFFSKTWTPGYSYPLDFFRDLRRYGDFTRKELYAIVGLAVFWTILRYILTVNVFRPLARCMNLSQLSQQKFPESAWKFMFYCMTWGLSVYILFYTGDYTYFWRPLEIWQGWSAGMEVPSDIYWVYMVQISFYLHSVYATLFMDHWRKDSLVMLFHHVLTLNLLGFSYTVRYHKIGILVLFVHDVTDVQLEFTKLNVYLKDRSIYWHKVHDRIATVGFLFFATSWFVFRLYWFPLKILYSTSLGCMMNFPHGLPFWFFFNVMLWILLILNIYWFMFIVNFLYKVMTGQMEEVDDIREHEVVEEVQKKYKENLASDPVYTNGDAPHEPDPSMSGDSKVVKNGIKGKKRAKKDN